MEFMNGLPEIFFSLIVAFYFLSLRDLYHSFLIFHPPNLTRASYCQMNSQKRNNHLHFLKFVYYDSESFAILKYFYLRIFTHLLRFVRPSNLL